ncbi:23224_t:CDS:2, partial [Gigaspora margarita]
EKIIKHLKHQDAKPLQKLYQLCPDLNGQSIKALSNKYFFKGKKSLLATIFLNPSCNRTSVGQISKEENQSSYFKNAEIITLLIIKTTLTTIIYSNVEFANINLVEGNNGSL